MTRILTTAVQLALWSVNIWAFYMLWTTRND